MTRPLKSAMTIADHIDLLRGRGMSVGEELARQWWKNDRTDALPRLAQSFAYKKVPR